MHLTLASEDSLLVDLLGNWPINELQLDELHLLINAERRCEDYLHANLLLEKRLGTQSGQLPDIIINRHQFWGEVAYSLLVAEQFDAALKGFELALELDPENHAYSNNQQVVLEKISERKSK